MALLGLADRQLYWAGRIVARVKARFPSGEGRDIAKRALMTALVESALWMYANRHNAESLRLPHDRVGQDHGSVGLFQQQVGGAPNSTANWGTTRELMDVNISTDKFVDALRRINWRGMSAGAACQAVQGSAYPDRYAGYASWGDQLVEAFWDGATGGELTVTVDRSVKSIQKLVGVTVDGIYGPDTRAAVKAWQKKHGLAADGIWGPKSDAAGFPSTSKPAAKAPAFPLPSAWYFGPENGPVQSVSGRHGNAHGSAHEMQKHLARYQRRMIERGWIFEYGADGLYGKETELNTRRFQKEKGLKADGLIGPKTWRAAWTEPVT